MNTSKLTVFLGINVTTRVRAVSKPLSSFRSLRSQQVLPERRGVMIHSTCKIVSLSLLALMVSSCGPERKTFESGSTVQEIVYGIDNRKDFYDSIDQGLRDLTVRSIVAQINKGRLNISNPSDVRLDPDIPDFPTLGEYDKLFGCPPGLTLCQGESFTDQPIAAECSGTLIDDDLVLTAGHCMEIPGACENFYWVFNYYYTQSGVLATIRNTPTADDIYSCWRAMWLNQGDLDWAIVQLDRPVTPDHSPAPVKLSDVAIPIGASVYSIGFPSGIPAKLDNGGSVIDGMPVTLNFFKTTTDSFKGNSGSGVFDANYELVGIEVAHSGFGSDTNDYIQQGSCCIVNTQPEDGSVTREIATYVARALDALCSEPFWGSDRLCVDECSSGVCCDTSTGKFRPSSFACDGDTERTCAFGFSCGSDVGIRLRHRYCTGTSDACPSAWSAWSDWRPAVLCTGSERCRDVGVTPHCYADPSCSCECSLGSGPCCDGCNFRPSSFLCEEDIATEYCCTYGEACGGEVFVRRLDKYCSGTSAQCNGMEAWDTPAVVDDCDQASRCQPGNPTCYVDPACGGHPPQLMGGDLDPPSGYVSDTFHFTVDYRDVDDDPPTKSDIVIVRSGIDDLRRSMTKVGISPDSFWNEYAADVLGGDIGLGTWSYYIDFESDGGSARRPSSGTFTGPSVMDVEPSVQITEPFGTTLVPRGGTVHFVWISTGCTSVSLAYTTTRDVPPTPGAGTSIASGLAPIGSYDWSIGALADGTYWILAECYNLTGSWDWHYGGPVTVSDIYVSDRAWYPSEDVSASGTFPDVAVGPDGTVHAVWSGAGTTYSQRAPDGTWTTPTTISSLNAGEGLNRGPRIAVGNDGRVHVAYAVDWPVTDLRYVGLDSGGNIVLGEQLIYNGAGVWISGIAVDGSGQVHVSWIDDIDDGYVYWARSSDGGATFSSPLVLGSGSAPNQYNGGRASISASGNYVHIVAQYMDWGVGEWVLHYFNSANGGSSWSSARTITTGISGNGIQYPEVASFGSDVHVIFNDGFALILNQAYMYSTNGGSNWSSPIELTVLDTNRGDVAAFDGQIFVVTTDAGGHFTESPDAVSWSESYTVHPDLNNSKMDVDLDGRVHIIGTTPSGTIVYIASRPPQICPTLTVLEPEYSGSLCVPTCSISWIGADEDGDTLSVRLSYDTDKDPTSTTGINGADSLPGSGMFSLDTSSMPSGSYWIYFEITDGICSQGSYSEGQIIVDRPPIIALNTPPQGDARAYPVYVLDWEASDPEGRELEVSIKWADDDFPDVYHLVADDLQDIGEYAWELTGFEHGTVLNLVAIVSDRVNASVVSYSPGQLIVHHPDRACVFDSDCPSSNVCSDGYCVCIPDCAGLECGTDPNCGQSCGSCPAGEECNNGQCGPVCTCTDGDVDGHYPESCADTDCTPRDDCDDNNSSVHPGASEVCNNNMDDDCDGQTDEGCTCTDIDDDGYCQGDDCNDYDSSINPGAAERCGNGVDDDCDGQTDEGCGTGDCQVDADCDDGNPCVRDVCVSGTCFHEEEPYGMSCGPNMACQIGECVVIGPMPFDESCGCGIKAGAPLSSGSLLLLLSLVFGARLRRLRKS